MDGAYSPLNPTTDRTSTMRPLTSVPPVFGAFLRGGRGVIAACLLALTLLAWLYLARLAEAMSAMGAGADSVYMWLMPMGSWGPAEFGLCVAMWAIMMIAMMVPSATPMLFAFHALDRSRRSASAAPLRFAAFFLGYVFVWSAFSVIAAGIQWWLHEAAVVTDMMMSSSRVFDGAILLCAGIYQFMPAKRRCLAKCRTPLGFLMSEWREGPTGAWLMGMRHGMFCVGCCWGLMALLFVGGVMNLLWIAVLAATVLVEKTVPFGITVARTAGIFMSASGVWLLFST
jgi:predicted metal-binding membrane protein